MNTTIIGKLSTELLSLLGTGGDSDAWIESVDLREPRAGANQFVLFLKPEVTAANAGVQVDKILELVWQELERNRVNVGAIRLLSSGYLRRNRIMDRHYGVINRISREGRDALSEAAVSELNTQYAAELKNGATVLGGHQFLERFPAFSPMSLNVLSDNLGTKKLAGGTYCIKATAGGHTFLILNPFHPFQLEHFTAPNRAIIAIEGVTDTSWQVLRQRLAGATNPARAADGSLRRILLDRKDELAIGEVNQGSNGVHLSAGPVEGMVEFQRFFSEHDNDKGLIPYPLTVFGRALTARGLSAGTIDAIAANPTVSDAGRLVSTFDLTEEMDAGQAAGKLLEVADRLKK